MTMLTNLHWTIPPILDGDRVITIGETRMKALTL